MQLQLSPFLSAHPTNKATETISAAIGGSLGHPLLPEKHSDNAETDQRQGGNLKINLLLRDKPPRLVSEQEAPLSDSRCLRLQNDRQGSDYIHRRLPSLAPRR